MNSPRWTGLRYIRELLNYIPCNESANIEFSISALTLHNWIITQALSVCVCVSMQRKTKWKSTDLFASRIVFACLRQQ